jgi:hypothetical protein
LVGQPAAVAASDLVSNGCACWGQLLILQCCWYDLQRLLAPAAVAETYWGLATPFGSAHGTGMVVIEIDSN